MRQKFHDWLFERDEEEDEASDAWGHVRGEKDKPTVSLLQILKRLLSL